MGVGGGGRGGEWGWCVGGESGGGATSNFATPQSTKKQQRPKCLTSAGLTREVFSRNSVDEDYR